MKELRYGCGEKHVQDGSFDEIDVWVRCENCIWWLHTACVQEGYDDTPEFMCRSCTPDDEVKGPARLNNHQENSASIVLQQKIFVKKIHI